MFPKLTIEDVKIRGQVVLVRTDYNVPLTTEAATPRVASDLRLRASLPTLQYLRDHGAKKIILMSHLGRPDGTRVRALSLRPVAERLGELLSAPVAFVDDVSGPDVEVAVDQLPTGGILLLENLRFFAGEERNSRDFAREIIESTHAQLFVQDGFAVIHRAHASTSAITEELPAVAGLLVQREVTALARATAKPVHPVTVVIGGSKVADKQPLVDRFAKLADHIFVGGKIAADGYQPATSEAAKATSATPATESSAQILVASDFSDDTKRDLGPASTQQLLDLAKQSQTVIWNGLLGMAEDPAYAVASTALARQLGTQAGLTSIICGGDTTGFVEHLQAEDSDLHYSLVSTGGGASLALLLGQPLPGLDTLEDR